MISVFEHPWLSGLFGDDEMARLWSTELQLGHARAYEIALAHALEAAGEVQAGVGTAAAKAIETAQMDMDQIRHCTGIDGLPVPELVRQLRDAAGEAGAAVHTGATSQDVLDTALALTLRATSELLQDRLRSFDAALQELDRLYGKNGLMGRTRMQAALPITVADRIAAWRRPVAGQIETLDRLHRDVACLQLGGAVGTAQALGDKADDIARHMAQALGLRQRPVWHTDRSGIIAYAGCLSTISGSLGKVGQDVALMAQQGIDDIALSGGGGSSAMPHKSNPVLAELLVSLARFNATQLAGMHHALIQEQERSGAAWMLEWMILPQMALATGRSLAAGQTLAGQVRHMGTPDRQS